MTVVRSPKSGVNFFSLGDFEDQLEMARVRAQPAIRQVSTLCMHDPLHTWPYASACEVPLASNEASLCLPF